MTEPRRGAMLTQFHRAVVLFDAELAGEVVHGVCDRTAGGRVATAAGDRWIRVIAAPPDQATGPVWDGPVTSAGIKGVTKPDLLAWREWADGRQGWRVRGELWTLAPGPVCSTTETLREDLALPDVWWLSLRESLDNLAGHATDRIPRTQQQISRVLPNWYGPTVDTTVRTWTTAHGDLRWTNLTRTGPYLLDWEFWGLAPAGTDAATLYCTSLLVPQIAERVHTVFADLLDSPDGRLAQLCVIVQLLRHPDCGELEDPLRQLAQQLLSLLDPTQH